MKLPVPKSPVWFEWAGTWSLDHFDQGTWSQSVARFGQDSLGTWSQSVARLSCGITSHCHKIENPCKDFSLGLFTGTSDGLFSFCLQILITFSVITCELKLIIVSTVLWQRKMKERHIFWDQALFLVLNVYSKLGGDYGDGFCYTKGNMATGQSRKFELVISAVLICYFGLFDTAVISSSCLSGLLPIC